MKKPRKAAVIGVPMELGASKAGCAGGPDAVRRTGLLKDLEALGFDAEDYGDLEIPRRDEVEAGSRRRKYLKAILSACRQVSESGKRALKAGRTPVFLGGDHSLALGSIGGVASHLQAKGKRLGLIWVDAHGDMNTPSTSRSGNVHGMPLAALIGFQDRTLGDFGSFVGRVRPQNVCLVGVRDLDRDEKEVIKASGVHVFTMKEIDIRGMAKVITQAIDFASDQTSGFHVSFDVDVVDPSVAQGTGTPSRGGLTYREAHLLMELVHESGRLTSLDMVEINPLEDVHNNTAELSGELIQSALGKTIY